MKPGSIEQSGTRSADEARATLAERRQLPRYVVDERATLQLLAVGARFECRMLDLSLRGCKLELPTLPPKALLQRCEINFRVRGFAFRMGGITLWTDRKSLVGIRFDEISPRRMSELSEAMGELDEAEQAARESAEEVEEAEPVDPSERVRADDALTTVEGDDDGSSLQAFNLNARLARQTVIERDPAWTQRFLANHRLPGAGGTGKLIDNQARGPLGPAVRVPLPKPAEPVRPARERRAEDRHDVHTTAILHLVNIATSLEGRILDLSLSGCRIRFEEGFPVGIYTRVEVEFQLAGLPFRLAGVVQSRHNAFQIGVRLLDMSERKRAQLEQLIEELKVASGDAYNDKHWTDRSDLQTETAEDAAAAPDE